MGSGPLLGADKPWSLAPPVSVVEGFATRSIQVEDPRAKTTRLDSLGILCYSKGMDSDLFVANLVLVLIAVYLAHELGFQRNRLWFPAVSVTDETGKH